MSPLQVQGSGVALWTEEEGHPQARSSPGSCRLTSNILAGNDSGGTGVWALETV